MSGRRLEDASLEPGVELDAEVETSYQEGLEDLYTDMFYNDDVTTFDFVIDIFIRLFDMDEREALQTAYNIHEQGRQAVGCFDYATAITRKHLVENEARDRGFPLRVEVELIQ